MVLSHVSFFQPVVADGWSSLSLFFAVKREFFSYCCQVLAYRVVFDCTISYSGGVPQ